MPQRAVEPKSAIEVALAAVDSVDLSRLRKGAMHSEVLTAPFDGRHIADVPYADALRVDEAVEKAHESMALPFDRWQRVSVLEAAVLALRDEREHLSHLIALEAAKPIRNARVEVDRAIETFAFAAAVARTTSGEMIAVDATAAGAGKLAMTLRLPRGVIGAITPFNFPLNLVAHKVAPAIAAGCAIVVKPAEQTPLSALVLAHLLTERCGLPQGFLQVLPGSGPIAGKALVENARVAMITFTGSTSVGWSLAAAAPMKKVALELGGNAPVIVEPDADWRRAARLVSAAGYSYAGQSCVSTQRVLVHEAIVDDFTDALAREVDGLITGNPLDEHTDVSALISARERERVCNWIDEAVMAGARVVRGGSLDGSVLTPTLLTDVSPTMRVVSDEVFGPVVALQRYDDFASALQAANGTRFGMQAGVFTASVDRALRAARELDFGAVLVNEVPTWRAENQPFGGVRASGNTREGPEHAVREMTVERLVIIDAGAQI